MWVKPHTAISETVTTTKHKPWTKSLINTILRNYLRATETLQTTYQSNPETRLNHPDWLIHQIEQCWPDQTNAILNTNDQAPPITLRINRLQNNQDNYLTTLNQHDIDAQTINFYDSALILDQPLNVEQLPNFREDRISIQNMTAQLTTKLLDIQPKQSVPKWWLFFRREWCTGLEHFV
jgi:tRNA and rRNA cytosine-C5-methylases